MPLTPFTKNIELIFNLYNNRAYLKSTLNREIVVQHLFKISRRRFVVDADIASPLSKNIFSDGQGYKILHFLQT